MLMRKWEQHKTNKWVRSSAYAYAYAAGAYAYAYVMLVLYSIYSIWWPLSLPP